LKENGSLHVCVSRLARGGRQKRRTFGKSGIHQQQGTQIIHDLYTIPSSFTLGCPIDCYAVSVIYIDGFTYE
jgi:hypothetical protein